MRSSTHATGETPPTIDPRDDGSTSNVPDGDAPQAAPVESGDLPRAAPNVDVGWDHTVDDVPRPAAQERPTQATPLAAQLLSILADPRVDTINAESAARVVGRPRQDVENTLDAMAQAGTLLATGDAPRSYRVPPEDKQRLESMFQAAAHELSERGVIARTSPDDSLAPLDDDVEEPRLPITAGLLSLFLPGTGQLLNGDVGRASLVFAVWSLAWITHLSPVWTFVCLYAGAEAFFTAKIRSMERKAASQRGSPPRGPRALPPKPSST